MGPNEYKLIQMCLNINILSGHCEFVTVYLGLVFEYTKTLTQLAKKKDIKGKAQTLFLFVRMLLFLAHCLLAAVLLPETAGDPVTTGRRHGAQMAHFTLYTHYNQ